MKSKDLIIVFVKNLVIGQVKTRLAVKIGDQKAFQVYSRLVEITSNVVHNCSADVYVYFSESIDVSLFSKGKGKVQEGRDLGEKMYNAFVDGFNTGYERIVLIGSDLPDLNKNTIDSAFNLLKEKDFVFGPAIDGGYYLIGMKSLSQLPFENMPWSTSILYEFTKKKLIENSLNIGELETMNDIDTYEDYLNSSIYSA